MDFWSGNYIKDLLVKYNFKCSRSLGQNFLIDQNICHKIVKMAQITNKDGVLEIGPGVGILTREIAKTAKKVVTVEIDKKLMPILEETLVGYKNIKVINEDILKLKLDEVIEKEFENQKIIVCANLPYYITSSVIINLLKNRNQIKQITVMVQKEVAQRMEAMPGTRESGILSLIVRYYSEPKILFEVSCKSFRPIPNVNSAVITLKIRNEPLIKVRSEDFLFKVIKASFLHRRKIVINSIDKELNVEKENLKKIFNDIGIDVNKRAEEILLEEYKEISEKLYEFKYNVKKEDIKDADRNRKKEK